MISDPTAVQLNYLAGVFDESGQIRARELRTNGVPNGKISAVLAVRSRSLRPAQRFSNTFGGRLVARGRSYEWTGTGVIAERAASLLAPLCVAQDKGLRAFLALRERIRANHGRVVVTGRMAQGNLDSRRMILDYLDDLKNARVTRRVAPELPAPISRLSTALVPSLSSSARASEVESAES